MKQDDEQNFDRLCYLVHQAQERDLSEEEIEEINEISEINGEWALQAFVTLKSTLETSRLHNLLRHMGRATTAIADYILSRPESTERVSIPLLPKPE